MREITLKIPDKKFNLFMEIIAQLGFIEIEEEITEIPDEHKAIIRERIKHLQQDKLLDWDEVKDTFKTE